MLRLQHVTKIDKYSIKPNESHYINNKVRQFRVHPDRVIQILISQSVHGMLIAGVLFVQVNIDF